MKRGIYLTQQWHFGSWLFEGWPQFPFFRQNLSALSRLSTASTECKEFNHKCQSVVQGIKKTKKLNCCCLCVLEGWQNCLKSRRKELFLPWQNKFPPPWQSSSRWRRRKESLCTSRTRCPEVTSILLHVWKLLPVSIQSESEIHIITWRSQLQDTNMRSKADAKNSYKWDKQLSVNNDFTCRYSFCHCFISGLERSALIANRLDIIELEIHNKLYMMYNCIYNI